MAVGIISAIPEEYTKLEWDKEPRTEIIVNKIFKFGTMNGIDVIAAELASRQPGSAQSVRMLNTKPENLGVVEVVVVVGENNNKQKKSLEEAVKGAVGTTSSNT